MGDVTYPLIITGMHRSGTSLLAQVLYSMGLHLGCDCRLDEMESWFLREQNMRIFKQARARWDKPGPMHRLLQDSERSDALVADLREVCCAEDTRDYLGAKRYRTNAALAEQEQPWGWKDPRNTFTLPLWLQVFPNTRIINIHRNGVDVANSLLQRAQRLFKTGDTGPIWRRIPRRCLHASRRMSLDQAFSLWAEYVTMNLETTATLAPDRVYSLSYEAFLENPVATLPDVTRFAGLQVDNTSLASAAADIRRDRAYAFTRDPALVEFYNGKAEHPLMVQLGYDNLTQDDSSSKASND